MHKSCRGCLFAHLLKDSPKGHPTIGRNVYPGDTQKILKQLPLATSADDKEFLRAVVLIGSESSLVLAGSGPLGTLCG